MEFFSSPELASQLTALGQVLMIDLVLAGDNAVAVGLAQNLAALQGSAYGVDTHFRISFAAATDYLEEGCRRIAAARAQLSH